MKATKAEAKTERIEVRVSPKQKRLLEMAIALDRQRSLSEFVTTSAVRAAKKIIRLYAQAEMDELTLKEKMQVAEMVQQRQTEMTPALAELMQEHARRVKKQE